MIYYRSRPAPDFGLCTARQPMMTAMPKLRTRRRFGRDLMPFQQNIKHDVNAVWKLCAMRTNLCGAAILRSILPLNSLVSGSAAVFAHYIVGGS
ncbi:hypothetical protein PQB33_gp41 [Ochrobactrum phage POA1180]|uniref:Uncharacterized protein n=1 Tax=Ochrobactrum phage POA1180 TaxID=1897640 RepID=A0A219VHD1_9CAUD|nr:hypothetical protein PQB33_gp41 [Ochrobactrum phage POA1180]AOT25349.1 hypothetical protein POA1180_41 [Ochrobactrum phage POA1180]